jgi:AcrR family transcriptional regulator
MKAVAMSSYHSPLRRAQAAGTREQILDAVARLVERGDDPTYAAVAKLAGVQERTVYRHFPMKSDLHRAFWARLHESEQALVDSVKDLASLRELVTRTFRGFDEKEPLIRALLHSEHGREIRLATNEARRSRFERVAATHAPERDRSSRRRVAAVAQVLSSAMAWEYLRDYWDMDANEASATVHAALTALLEPPARPKATASRAARSGAKRPRRKEKP